MTPTTTDDPSIPPGRFSAWPWTSVDGILFHQLLQLHGMLSARYPDGVPAETAVVNIEINMFWDGRFDALTWTMTVAGLVLLWRVAKRGDVPPRLVHSSGRSRSGGDCSTLSRASSTTTSSTSTTSPSGPSPVLRLRLPRLRRRCSSCSDSGSCGPRRTRTKREWDIFRIPTREVDSRMPGIESPSAVLPRA